MYQVKELFYTLQGEGMNAGRPAVFCRFAGCNLWSGHQKDRASAVCKFCDTDFVGTEGTDGGKYESQDRPDPRVAREGAELRADHPARVCARSGGRRSDRPSQVQRRRAGTHATEENRSGGEKTRGALSGSSRKYTRPRFGGVFVDGGCWGQSNNQNRLSLIVRILCSNPFQLRSNCR
jgi:hypothetical protein